MSITTVYTKNLTDPDAAAVLDACDVERTVAVGLPRGAWYALELAALRHDAIAGLVLVGAALEAEAMQPPPSRPVVDLLAELRCPTLVLHGCDDHQSHDIGVEAARLSNGTLVSFNGSGHMPNLRDPVRFSLLLREFVERVSS